MKRKLFCGMLLCSVVAVGGALYGGVLYADVQCREGDSNMIIVDDAQIGADGNMVLTPPSETGDDWNLMLVNAWNELPEDFSVELKELDNGQAIDERVYPYLQAMMDAAREEGLSPVICSSYRTNEKQQALYQDKVSDYLSQGYSRKEAEAEAAKWVAYPGTSEHQAGLAVDIVALDYQILDKKQENTDEQEWLMKNSYKYGFILRYPNDKSEITGISYEPWHYRYVGKKAAKEIYENDICLEEYLDRVQ